MPRPPTAAALAALALAAAGCGGSGAAAQRPQPVRLTITGPADAATARGATVEVAGRVAPARARVLVAGRPAAVDGGTFRATVALSEGTNLIDVGAYAPGRTATWTALRVTRVTLVAVPDLTGALSDDAVAALQARGLKPVVDNTDGFLQRLLPGNDRVCETRPAAGARVPAGTAVHVAVSRSC